jgi:hypothetical protein
MKTKIVLGIPVLVATLSCTEPLMAQPEKTAHGASGTKTAGNIQAAEKLSRVLAWPASQLLLQDAVRTNSPQPKRSGKRRTACWQSYAGLYFVLHGSYAHRLPRKLTPRRSAFLK